MQMDSTMNLDLLAARAGRGDSLAALQLRRELEPQMVRIVSQALRAGTAGTPLARQILARARQAVRHGGGPEGVVRTVARDLCESVIGRLRQGPQHARALQDTLCA
jgi:hypothetical protein